MSDADGFTQVELPGNKLTRDLLNSDDVFIVDVGNKLYVWVGKGASPSERRESMTHAMQYITQNGYPNSTPIERVSDGGETPTFKAEFVMWNPPQALTFGARASSGVAATQADQKVIAVHRSVVLSYFTFSYIHTCTHFSSLPHRLSLWDWWDCGCIY